jgi:general secretion pathway protein D
MTVKTTLLILLLTAFGLAAQMPPFPSPRTNALPDAVRAAMRTNSPEFLRQEMRRALAGGTNAAARATAANSAKTSAAPVLSVPPVAVPSAPPPSAAGPGNLAGPQGVLTPSNAPAATLPVVTTPPAGLVATPSPGAKSPLEEPLQPGMIDFRSADLNQVLDIYSMMVNRTILRPATLPAPTITLTTHGQLTVGEGIQALEAVLGLNGITMVNMGDKFVKAMPEAQGNTAGARFDTNSAAHLPDMGQYITHVVQLKYAKPSEMVPVLSPFIKIPNAILPIDSSQILVLRDYTENVKRMLELIKDIDVAVPSEFVSEVIPIKYAKAGDIASALNSLSSGGGGASLGGGTGTGTSSRSTRSSGMGRTGTTGGYPGQNTMPGMGGMQPGATGTTPAAQPGSSFSQRLQNIIQRASATGDIQVLGQTKIISDERTNSLLIYASKDDMKIIKDIVSKLDVVLAQVLIEAVIIEVALKNSRDLGIAAYEQQPHPGSGYFKGLGAANNGTSFSPSPLVSTATNVATTLPGGFSYLASFGQDLDVTVTAVAADSRARILQRPRIQTSHNEPAMLFVGESRPYPTSSYYGGGGYGGYSSIQQMQIGVTLEVTPLINPDGLVVMDIHQKIDSVSGTVSIANVGDVPVTSSKEASAKVSVRDHDTIILGGLIETDKNKSGSGVPLLMDIPVLGYLFRSSHNDESRSELIVLIRPTVLPTPEIAALAATAEKNKMPGVRGTEKEIRDEETRRLKQADSAEKGNPYQPVAKP